MSKQLHRREFLQRTALTGAAVAGAGYWSSLAAKDSDSPNEKIRFACVGVTGKGQSDSDDAGRHGDVVAVCDVDDKNADNGVNRFKQAEKFFDFRKMFEKKGANIDAFTVSTADHNHAVISAMGMKMGKHCFCQKPLTHTIFEARTIGDIAREKKVATQMGNQGTEGSGLREAAAMVQAGVLGKVTDVHVWSNRPIWPQGGDRPKEETVPANLHWEEWLGPAPYRPYAKGYHPFAWRGWWDFGTGALGDMACHTVNLPYMALGLRDPIAVSAESSGTNKDSYAKWSIIKFEFPATEKRGAVTMHWYDGGKKAPPELLEGKPLPGSGMVIVGDKGKLFSPDDYGGSFQLLGGAEKVKVEFPKSPGHFVEWVNAIKDPSAPKPMSNFADYAGPLVETILLGNLAVFAGNGNRVEWDAKNMKPTNMPELDQIVKTKYRDGYSL